MDISLSYMNSKIAKVAPMPQIGIPTPHIVSFKLKNSITISCRSSASDRIEKMQDNKKMANFYEVLSLGSKNVGLQDIKKAYRSMALQYHPDACPDPSAKEESTRRFIELQKAYETLSNPISRKLYDYELSLGYDNLGFGLEGSRSSSMFSKEVWENQLRGLKRRSQIRMKRRKC